MNPATQPPAVHSGVIDPQIQADRIGYEAGYRGMENPSPYDDSIPAATFRARCTGWLRGHDDRRFGKPHQFADELASLDEEYRPTAGSEFVPTPDDEAERLKMITADGNESPPEYRERVEQLHRERMDEAFGGPEVTWHPAELAEAGSRSGHPAYEG